MKSKFYAGIYLGRIYCVATKDKYIIKYFEENHKCNDMETYDILNISESKYWELVSYQLISIYGKVLTINEFDIITDDFNNTYMDEVWTTYNNLKDTIKLVKDKSPLIEASNIYESILMDKSERAKVFKKYFNTHFIINMSISTYEAHIKAFPDYHQAREYNPYI